MSNLLNRSTALPVYREANGIQYPWAEEYTKILMNMFWKFDSVELGKDIEDFAKADKEEREFIINILRLFTQNEVMVSHGYIKMSSIFKPEEVLNWLAYANGTEVTHKMAYSLFTETVMPNSAVYTEFLDINVMATKTTFLDKAKVRKYEDYKAVGMTDAEVDREFRRSVARMLGIYGGGAELVSLYAQFAMLLAYQTLGKYPGLCQIVEYSIREEFVHGMGNCNLFRDYVSENKDIWDDELKYDIYEGMRELVSYEESLINYLKPPHLDTDLCKEYVRYQADEALKELGMKPNWNASNPFPFMAQVTGTVLTDFFSGKVTSYSRKMLGTRGGLRDKIAKGLQNDSN
jgi:ribonucleoside-diphosphate reductase beta chain